MTPFHNALLMCAVANEGTLMKPYVVDHVEGADGTTVKETIPEIYADLTSVKRCEKAPENASGSSYQWYGL